jgi:hypothetical protein
MSCQESCPQSRAESSRQQQRSKQQSPRRRKEEQDEDEEEEKLVRVSGTPLGVGPLGLGGVGKGLTDGLDNNAMLDDDESLVVVVGSISKHCSGRKEQDPVYDGRQEE